MNKQMQTQLLTKFGENVKKERVKRNLSQEELATLAGVHRTYIGMIERAEKNITLGNIKKIADALHMTISKLVSDL